MRHKGTETQRFPDLKTLRHVNTEAQGHSGARAERDRNTESEDAEPQRCRATEAQRYSDAVTQKHGYRGRVARLVYNAIDMRILGHMPMHLFAPVYMSSQQSLPESGSKMLARRQRRGDAIPKPTMRHH